VLIKQERHGELCAFSESAVSILCVYCALCPVLCVSTTLCVLCFVYQLHSVSYALCINYTLCPMLCVSTTICVLCFVYQLHSVSYALCINYTLCPMLCVYMCINVYSALCKYVYALYINYQLHSVSILHPDLPCTFICNHVFYVPTSRALSRMAVDFCPWGVNVWNLPPPQIIRVIQSSQIQNPSAPRFYIATSTPCYAVCCICCCMSTDVGCIPTLPCFLPRVHGH